MVPRLDQQAVRRAAKRLGFVGAGFVEARPWPDLRRSLEDRQRDGTYPAFCEADAARRADPQTWLAGARTIIVAAYPYRPPGRVPRPAPQAGPAGRLAAYSLPADYHGTLARRLRVLARWMARVTGSRLDRDFLVMVDTGPAAERDLWRRSGAGWIGKNACAYAPGAGSWILLGVLVTTLELAGPVVPAPGNAVAPVDACGTCRRCVDACPTGALSPYAMDPGRCLSQTTQLRGVLEPDGWPDLHRWVFGCDVCQMVCPHNRPEVVPAALGPRALAPLPRLAARMPLAEILTMDDREFRRRFGPSAAAWRGRSVIQRNAAYALGRALKGQGGVQESPLLELLDGLGRSHSSPVVAEACRRAARFART